jgi:hypothetical protein
MTFKLRPLFPRMLWVLAALVIVAFATGIVYTASTKSSAAALIASARAIHSTADAEREIVAWRKRSGARFWDESDRIGGDHNYEGQITNLGIARFGIIQPAAVSLVITTRGGELRGITLMMMAGRKATATPSVWIQEWFGHHEPPHFHVSQKSRPWAGVVEFSSSVPEVQRRRAFALNTKCFVQFNACKSAADILPGLWELDTQLSGKVLSRSFSLASID